MEDQNAAAIQSIINANLESTIEIPSGKTAENSKEINEKVAAEPDTVLENVSTSASADSTILKGSEIPKDNNFHIVNSGDNTVLPLEHNENAELSSSQQNDIVLFDGNVTYSNQMPTSSFYWDASKTHFSVPVVLTQQPAILKPVPNMDNNQSIVITVPSLLTQEVITTSDKLINEPENGQQSSSIIVCSEQNVSQPPPTSPEICKFPMLFLQFCK